MKRVKDFFLSNMALKILSIVFAVIVWLLVVNINNPNQSRNFTTNVEVINEQVLTANGKYYTIPEGQNTVTFRVTAARNVIERLSSNDFYAVADMINLEDDSRIPITITALNYAGSVNISSQLRYLNVEVGEVMSEKYMINVVPEGTPARGFMVDHTSVSPNVITVTGPDKIVSSIDEVRVICDVNGMSTDITENVIPLFLNKDDERIDTTKLTLSVSDVSLNVVFTNYKEVPIALEGLGLDANGNTLIDQVTFTPDKVSIRGSSSILNDITEITIPSSVVDVESLTEDVSTTVDITRYLPEGVRLMDESQAEVLLEIKLYTEGEKEFIVPVSNITVRNLERGNTATFEEENISLNLLGISSILDQLEADDITGSIDVSGLGEGEHVVRFIPDEDDRYSVIPATVKVIITSEESEGTDATSE